MSEVQRAGGALAVVHRGYVDWLARRPLAARTRRTYAERVGKYLAWLEHAEVDGDPLTDRHARDFAARDFRRHLLVGAKATPATVNTSLAAVASLYDSLGLGPPDVPRVDLPARGPRALDVGESRRLLRAAERCGSARDRALVVIAHETALRLAELAALDVDDVPTTERTGEVIVRAGKGQRYRRVPLSAEARKQLRAWLGERPDAPGEPAVWLNQAGGRMTERSIQHVVARVARAAGLQLSPHVLRHTAATRWLRAGTDVVTVAELLGHADLATVRRYTLPTAGDLTAAVERGAVDY